jgi:hypothetical protein
MYFSHWPRRIPLLADRGLVGKKGGARRGLRHDGRASEEKRRKKRDSELWKKRRGTNASLYLAELRASRLASFSAMPDAVKARD